MFPRPLWERVRGKSSTPKQFQGQTPKRSIIRLSKLRLSNIGIRRVDTLGFIFVYLILINMFCMFPFLFSALLSMMIFNNYLHCIKIIMGSSAEGEGNCAVACLTDMGGFLSIKVELWV